MTGHKTRRRAPARERTIKRRRGVAEAAPKNAPQRQRIQKALHQPAPKTNLKVGPANDRFEQEADSMASKVMTMRDPGVLTPQKTPEKKQVQAKGTPGQGGSVSPRVANSIKGLRGGGVPLPKSSKAFFEPRFGQDFSKVRLHTDAKAADMADSIQARAFTLGNDIAFAKGAYNPESTSGKRLLAHELTHTVQQASGFQKKPQRIQRTISPEDVSSEIVGRKFEVTKDFSEGAVNLPTGTKVTVLTWTNADKTVSVSASGVPAPVSIPKTHLKPSQAVVAGVDQFGAGISSQAAAVEKNEKELATWVAKESSYKSEKAVALFKEEKERLEGLLKKRQKLLNRKLIQETMFNRFDTLIKSEVDAANTARGLTGADALDPNLLKSMLFQETQLGTAGRHLEVPPTHPVKSRFNLGQVIDSSGLALLTVLEKEHPLIVSTNIPNLRTDLESAQKERKVLKKLASPTPADTARLIELDGLAKQNWEVFIWGYAPTGGVRFADAVATFFASQIPGLDVDYEFWIHMAVFWLFEKHKPGRTWAETIKAYNGSGKRATNYRDAVVKRAKDAKAAGKKGEEFIPGKI